jgi:cellulose synthase/poly-beta-1,6-N-acetylglucosamine synthase-like glycosyltransferase
MCSRTSSPKTRQPEPEGDPRGQAPARPRTLLAVLPELVFWCSTGALTWVYAGYPMVVGAVARLSPVRLRPTGLAPELSIAIAVHDEATHIAERIADVFGQERSGARIREVLVGSDGSTDETDTIIRDLSRTEPRLRLLALSRGGQTATQSALFDAATGDVVVLTDAETRFAPGCLAALAEPFRDPRVGCATGRLEWRDEKATATSTNEGLYWQYERIVRELESDAGFLTAVTGALLAVRRSAYRPVPASASMDHLLPLYVREQGGLVVYVPAALATDRPISGLREQFRNRTRTATRGIRANLSMAGRLAPWRTPKAAFAIWSHKILRWATPWFIALAVGSGLVLGTTRPAYLFVPIGIGVAAIAAVGAHLAVGLGRRPPRAIAFARAFAVVCAAFALSWVNVLRGRRIDVWHRAEWDARSTTTRQP